MADHNEEAIAQHPGHADTLRFVISLCLCYTLCVAFLRVYTRWRAYSLDDLVVLLSGVSTLLRNRPEPYESVLLTSLHTGIGA